MTTARAEIELINDSEYLGIVRAANGDYHEIRGYTWNQCRRFLEDFCKLNGIALTEIPHRESWAGSIGDLAKTG